MTVSDQSDSATDLFISLDLSKTYKALFMVSNEPDSQLDLSISLFPFLAALLRGISLDLSKTFKALVTISDEPGSQIDLFVSLPPSLASLLCGISISLSQEYDDGSTTVVIWQENQWPLKAKYLKLVDFVLSVLTREEKAPRLRRAAAAVAAEEGRRCALVTALSLDGQAAAAGLMVITHGATRIKLPNGDHSVLVQPSGKNLAGQRQRIYGALGIADHWSEFENAYEIMWPNILARIDLGASDGSFHPPHNDGITSARPSLAAMQCAELQVVAFGGRGWTRFPGFITSQAGLEPLWDLIDEMYDLWPDPVKALVPLLANGEPPEFEAVWRKLSGSVGQFSYKVRSPTPPCASRFDCLLTSCPITPPHRLTTSPGRTPWQVQPLPCASSFSRDGRRETSKSSTRGRRCSGAV